MPAALPSSPASAAPARGDGTASLVLRRARPADLPALLAIEEQSFAGDRLSRRSFQHLLSRGHAILLVAERGGVVVGDAVVLLHGRTALARLYSLAVDPAHQGAGIGAALLARAEAEAAADGRAVMRLEVRPDNAAALRRYRAAGYREIGTIADYYDDHAPALRMEKRLAGGDRPGLRRVPYYSQSLDFTCGPASLMMAMKALDPDLALDRTLELRLWRESTLIFMMAGHGGCSPYGLALAAARRGFSAELLVSDAGPLFLDSVRSSEKKEVMRLVHDDFRRQTAEAGIPVRHRIFSGAALTEALDRGAFPVVLISSWRLYGEKQPHWVVLTGRDARFLYLHDPAVDPKRHRTATDCMNIPLTPDEFVRMARFGAAGLRAAVVIGRHAAPGRTC